jgi:hypothetical protein
MSVMKKSIEHEIHEPKGNLFYFYSDGYEDPFGGPEG